MDMRDGISGPGVVPEQQQQQQGHGHGHGHGHSTRAQTLLRREIPLRAIFVLSKDPNPEVEGEFVSRLHTQTEIKKPIVHLPSDQRERPKPGYVKTNEGRSLIRLLHDEQSELVGGVTEYSGLGKEAFEQDYYLYKEMDQLPVTSAYDLEPDDYTFYGALLLDDKKWLTLDGLEWIIDILDKNFAFEGKIDSSLAFVEETYTKLLTGGMLDPIPNMGTVAGSRIFEKIMSHYLKKRESINNRPLSPALRPAPSEKNHDYKLAFRPLRLKTRLPNIEKTEQLIEEITRASAVMESVVAREQQYLKWMHEMDENFNASHLIPAITDALKLKPLVPVLYTSHVEYPQLPPLTEKDLSVEPISRETAVPENGAFPSAPRGLRRTPKSSLIPIQRKRNPQNTKTRDSAIEEFLLPHGKDTDNEDYSWSKETTDSDSDIEPRQHEPRVTVVVGLAAMPWYQLRMQRASETNAPGFARQGIDGRLYYYAHQGSGSGVTT